MSQLAQMDQMSQYQSYNSHVGCLLELFSGYVLKALESTEWGIESNALADGIIGKYWSMV